MSKQKKKPGASPVVNETKKPAYRWMVWLIFFSSFFLYARTISYDYALDDGMFIENNKFVRNGIASFIDLVTKGSMYGINESNVGGYRPVVLVNFALEFSIFGSNSKAFHFFNVFLYALLCVVLFNFLKKILSEFHIFIPLLITILFIVHPLHTEVVANIKSRDEILCMLFGILSLNFIYAYSLQKTKRINLLLLACLCFFLSVFSKENGYAFLALMPLVLYFFSGTSLKKTMLLIVPFVVVTALTMLIRMAVLDAQFVSDHITPYDNSLLAANSIADRMATNFRMLFHALLLLVFPVVLSWDYSYNHFPIVNWRDTLALTSLLIHFGLLIFALAGIKKKGIFSFVILFYFISYFITSNLIINIGSSFGERFLFTPSLAFCIGLPFILAKLFKIDPITIKGQKILYANGLAIFIVLLFIIKTIDRTRVWENNATLFSSGLHTAPKSARVHASYAKVYMKKAEASVKKSEKIGFADTAIIEFKKAIEIYPDDFDMHYNIGVVYFTRGDSTNALLSYQKSLKLNPNYTSALNNIGVIYTGYKDYNKALEHFLQIIKIRNKDSRAWGNAGACYQLLQDTKKAFYYYEKALEFNPNNKDVLGNIATLYEKSGDSTKAKAYRYRLLNNVQQISEGE